MDEQKKQSTAENGSQEKAPVEATAAPKRTSITESGANRTQIAKKLLDYLTNNKTMEFEVLFETIVKTSENNATTDTTTTTVSKEKDSTESEDTKENKTDTNITDLEYITNRFKDSDPEVGGTLLYHAAYRSNIQIVTLLLKHKVKNCGYFYLFFWFLLCSAYLIVTCTRKFAIIGKS